MNSDDSSLPSSSQPLPILLYTFPLRSISNAAFQATIPTFLSSASSAYAVGLQMQTSSGRISRRAALCCSWVANADVVSRISRRAALCCSGLQMQTSSGRISRRAALIGPGSWILGSCCVGYIPGVSNASVGVSWRITKTKHQTEV